MIAQDPDFDGSRRFSEASNAASHALHASLGATVVTRSIEYARPVAAAAAPTITA